MISSLRPSSVILLSPTGAFPNLRNKSNTRPTPKAKAAGCATGRARLMRPIVQAGLLSLYFGLFLSQVHIVATVVAGSRGVLHTPNFGELTFHALGNRASD